MNFKASFAYSTELSESVPVPHCVEEKSSLKRTLPVLGWVGIAGSSVFAGDRGVSGSPHPGEQILAGSRARGQCLRRPAFGVFVRGDGGVCGGVGAEPGPLAHARGHRTLITHELG